MITRQDTKYTKDYTKGLQRTAAWAHHDACVAIQQGRLDSACRFQARAASLYGYAREYAYCYQLGIPIRELTQRDLTAEGSD